MFDQIISSLKDQVAGDLMEKVGLSPEKTDGSINAAADSVKEVIGGGKGFDIGSVLNLFSKDDNNEGGNDLMGRISQTFMGNLTSKVGLDADKASSVSALIMPALMGILGDKVGGNSSMLGNLFGNAGDGILGGLKDKIGGIGKMFG